MDEMTKKAIAKTCEDHQINQAIKNRVTGFFKPIHLFMWKEYKEMIKINLSNGKIFDCFIIEINTDQDQILITNSLDENLRTFIYWVAINHIVCVGFEKEEKEDNNKIKRILGFVQEKQMKEPNEKE
jgi:hypothetical protein